MRRRLLLFTVATTSTVIIAFLVPLLALVRETTGLRADAAASSVAEALAPVVATVTDLATLTLSLQRVNADSDCRTTVFMPDGGAIGAAAAYDDDVKLAATRGRAQATAAPGGRAVLVPVVLPDGRRAVIRTFVPKRALVRGMAEASFALGALGVALLGLALAVSAVLARALSRPLEDTAATAVSILAGRLDARAEVTGPPEVARIAGSLNLIAERIAVMLQAERESVADLSHRLRTPLTALRLNAENLRDPAEAERLTADADALERMVTHLIKQARRPTVRPSGASSDLGAIVRERTAFWSVLAEDQARAVTVWTPLREVVVPVPAEDLAAAIDALIGNVFAHTPAGVSMTVTVEDGVSGPTLLVEDAGPGIADPRVLERGTSSATSSGLGLDVVRTTAREAGGEMILTNLEPTGLRVLARLGPPPDAGRTPRPSRLRRRPLRHRARRQAGRQGAR
jgi:signal transduction histidine kinase